MSWLDWILKRRKRKKSRKEKRAERRKEARLKRRARRRRERQQREKSREERYRGKTANQIISGEKKGSINREFPGEWRDKTWEEINDAAKEGDRTARKAKKLLEQERFDKDS